MLVKIASAVMLVLAVVNNSTQAAAEREEKNAAFASRESGQPLASSSVRAKGMPPGWTLPAIYERPCLLVGPADALALRSRLVQAFGSPEAIKRDWALYAFLKDDAALRRKATDQFLAYWRNYSRRWSPETLADYLKAQDARMRTTRSEAKGVEMRDPNGVDMRGIWRTIYQYDLVESFGMLTEDEKREFRDKLVGCVERAMGPARQMRDVRAQQLAAGERLTAAAGTMNIHSDVVIAAGTVGLAFPELPQSREWIEFAAEELLWQLDNMVWNGAWHESPRYHAHMVKIVGLFFHSLKRRTGVDLFPYPQFKAMLDWLVRFQTPLDRVAGKELGVPGGVPLVPGIGDSSWTNSPLSLLGMFAPHYVKDDPDFAARLMWAWQRGGRSYDAEWAQVLIDPALPVKPQTLGSDSSPGKGYVLMRSGFDTPEDLWLLLRCGKATRAGHDNADWNAFNLYAFGLPFSLDSASGPYEHKAHKGWHDKAIAHNTVVFGKRSQARLDGKILGFLTRPEADYSVSDASVPAGVKRFIRHVLFVKPDYFVLWDQISADEEAAWVLHTPATELEWSEHAVRCIMPWRAELDVHMVLPAAPLTPWEHRGRFGDWWEENGKKQDVLPFYYQKYLRVPNLPGADFLVLLHPRRPDQPELSVRRVESAGQVVEVTCGEQRDRVEFRDCHVTVERRGPRTLSIDLPVRPPQ